MISYGLVKIAPVRKVAVAEVTRIYRTVAHGHLCGVFKCRSKLRRDVFLHSHIAEFYILA